MSPRMSDVRPIGVDVGGTSVRAGVVDAEGGILDTASAPTPRTDDALEAAIAGAVDELRRRHTVAAVGLALAGFVDAPRGLVRYAPHLSWRDAPVAERIGARLEEEGVDAEVLDLRCLRPLDTEAILATVTKTHRAVVVDEGWRSVSLAAEVMARIAEGAFYELDAPLERVCAGGPGEVLLPRGWVARREGDRLVARSEPDRVTRMSQAGLAWADRTGVSQLPSSKPRLKP